MWWLRATQHFKHYSRKSGIFHRTNLQSKCTKKEQEKLLRYYSDDQEKDNIKKSLKFSTSTSKWWLHISTFHEKSSRINWTMARHLKLCWSLSARNLQIAAICELQIYAGAEKPIKLQLARPNNNRAVAKQEAKSTDLTDNYFLRLKVIWWTLVTCVRTVCACEQRCRGEVNQTITNYVIIECMSYELNHFSWKFHSFQRAHSQ